ncbi:S-adenosylmethionine decarboxylase proenzyme [Xenorhabdus beddingii]|uniref:S-adenosylmethionine decarboxylase proenzyme n=1 Tax=Xenorhabdus beddingii TaxID=40578 RepID=A0A1Y2SFF2_9GAMM|nr:adenosylmethionine decarboxylase [Xenorhabdus beddingii]OTA16738.1 S-adenosylmethionine decarboxylase proenzyme [Xenorhabdus beddingii]
MNNTLNAIKNNMTLTHPVELLETLLIHLYLGEHTSNKALSLKSGLPIPIVSAFKKELVKFNLADKKGIFKLNETGVKYVKDSLGYKSVNIPKYISLSSDENRKEFECELLALLKPIYELRPQVNVMLDQAHGTLETAIRRVMLLLKNPNIFKQKILFLGDDDLTSLALGIALKMLGHYNSQNICVKDIDKELLEFIKSVSEKNDFIINTEYIDLKNAHGYTGKFDIILTDPPYTLSGLKLFLSRAISFSRNENSEILLSFGQKRPEQHREIQRLFHHQNLLIKNIYPQFNEYHGGSIIGNVSDLYVLSVTQNTYPTIPENSAYSSKIYTGELNPRVKFYQCKTCYNTVTIGYGKHILTIEKLIETGCAQCCGTKFQYRGQEKIPLPIHSKQRDTKQLGTHLVLEMKHCDSHKLKSVSEIKTIMLDVAHKCHLNVVTHNFHEFKPYGVSGVLILAESHFTIHTWPEYDYAALDLFICNEFEHQDTFITQLKTQLNSQEYEYKILQRGF